MSHKLMARSICALTLSALCAGAAVAAKRHEHGHADVEVVIDGRELHVHWRVPTESFMGFGYAPQTEADRATWQRSARDMKDAAQWLRPNAQAQCRVVDVDLDLPCGEAAHDGHKHEQEHQQAHAHEHRDQHEHEHEHAQHSDIEWTVAFACQKPSALQQLEFDVFQRWPRLRVVHVQMVSPSGQTSADLKPEQNRLAW